MFLCTAPHHAAFLLGILHLNVMPHGTHILTYTLIPLLIIVAAVSYVRFMIADAYLVSYEGPCDPVSQSCFVGCDDDECTSEYYYSEVTREATAVAALCGTDVTECDAAFICSSSETACSITYCDPEIDGEDSCDATL